MIWKPATPTVDRDAAYEAWAPGYPARAHNALMEVEERALLALLPPLAGRRVLDVGCGSGRYMRLLAGRGAGRVCGVDLSAAMLARAREHGLALVRGDALRLPVCALSIDVVVAGLVLADVAHLDAFMGEVGRVLTARGTLVASTLHPRGAAAGWRRTFETPLGRRELRACWHSMEEVDRACARAGLRIDAVLEPELPGQGALALVIRARRVEEQREHSGGT